jgi:hypothetical protein
MNIDPVHLAFRSTTEGAQKILGELEAELAEAKARRDKILVDIGKAQAAAEKGDRRQLFVLGSLNKHDAAAGRLVLSVERQIAEARKRLDMMENQVASAEARKNGMATPDGAAKWRWFEITAPDGRVLRHKAVSFAELQKSLLRGYKVTAEVFGSSSTGVGGVAAQIGSDVPSIMEGLLAAHGKDLEAWLAERGIVGSIAQAPELAGRNFAPGEYGNKE